MKLVKLLLLIPLFISSLGYAAFPQEVKVCALMLRLPNPDESVKAEVFFQSSDFFDEGFVSDFTSHGQLCITHTYSQGPKTLAVQLHVISRDMLLLLPDASCVQLGFTNSYHLFSGNFNTGHPHVTWNFTLTEVAPPVGYKSSFAVSCQYDRR